MNALMLLLACLTLDAENSTSDEHEAGPIQEKIEIDTRTASGPSGGINDEPDHGRYQEP